MTAIITPLSIAHIDDDAAYERERLALVGNKPSEAGIYWGQGIARLIFKYSQRPGWTEQRLADKEKALGNKGASQSYIHYKIVFGEFLEIITIGDNGKIPSWTKDLSERRFRECWELAKGTPDKDARFREVTRMLTEPSEKKLKLGKDILNEFADGKWHRIETIAARVDRPVEEVLKHIQKRHWAGGSSRAKAEIKKVGRGHQVQIFRRDKTVSTAELTEKLRPIIDDLMVEGRKGQIRVSTGKILSLGGQLRQLLDGWTQ